MKRKMLLLALCLGLALAATSCSDDRMAAGKAVKAAPASMVDKLSLPQLLSQLERQRFTRDTWAQLLSQEPLAVTDTLITSFFDYYDERPDELAYLPEFAQNHPPNWDELTLYTFLVIDSFGEEPIATWPKQFTSEQFRRTIQRFLGDVSYIDQPSDFFEYQDGIYTVMGFDTLGTTFFRLKAIERHEENVYQAKFDCLYIDESDFGAYYNMEEEPTHNMRVIMEFADRLGKGVDIERSLAQIFLRDDYDQLLELNGEITIRFSLSGDDQLPFAYHACTRTYPNPYY